jgi:hypothetical protein
MHQLPSSAKGYSVVSLRKSYLNHWNSGWWTKCRNLMILRDKTISLRCCAMIMKYCLWQQLYPFEFCYYMLNSYSTQNQLRILFCWLHYTYVQSIFYLYHILKLLWKESNQLVLPRASCYFIQFCIIIAITLWNLKCILWTICVRRIFRWSVN